MNNPKQDGAEWLQHRVSMVTGSRVPAILGHSPWMTREDVMKDMILEYQGKSDMKYNVAMQWGIDNEENARKAFESEFGEIVTLHGFVPHPDIDFIGCSPDGSLGKEVLMEFKCPYSKKIPDEAPEHYIDQCQFNMHVMNLQSAILYYWTPSETRDFHIIRDDDWWDNTLPILVEFIDEFNDRKDDEIELEYVIEDEAALDIASQLVDVQEQLKMLSGLEKKLKEELAEMTDVLGHPDAPTKVGRMVGQVVTRAGSVDWKNLASDLSLANEDIEEFRKPDTTYIKWSVSK